MRFTSFLVASILAAIGFASSITDDVAQLPACSTECLQSAISDAGCDLTDYACQCGAQKAAIIKSATPCVVQACTSNADILKVQSLTGEICTLQAAAAPAGSSAASSVTSAVSSAASVASSIASSAAKKSSSATASATSTQASTAGGNRLQAAGGLVGAAFIAALGL